MKVKDLMEILESCDKELEVVMSSDEEGNSYLPLRVVDGDDVFYHLKEREMLDGEELREYDEEDRVGFVKCVVVWP